jgi:hypothetical protein
MFGGREAVTRKERAVCVLTRPAVFFVFISPQS